MEMTVKYQRTEEVHGRDMGQRFFMQKLPFRKFP